MRRNLKTLGLATAAILALAALVASSASAAGERFHSDGPRTILTGQNIGKEKFAVGAAGAEECETSIFESTVSVNEETPGTGTYTSSSITLRPTYAGCFFGGTEAHITTNDCAYVFSSETSGTDAPIEIECAAGNKMETDITGVCTVLIPPQKVAKGGVHYEADPNNPTSETSSSITVKWTLEEIKVEKKKTTEGQAGCALIPTGNVGVRSGTSTFDCRKDENLEPQANPTTPTGTVDPTTTHCDWF